jgi:hypothetical protein
MTPSSCESGLYMGGERAQSRKSGLGASKVTVSSANIAYPRAGHGFSWAGAIWKGILNQLVERAEAGADRRRLAALSLRHLDDIGMTRAERAAILGHEEPARDPWALVATHRL